MRTVFDVFLILLVALLPYVEAQCNFTFFPQNPTQAFTDLATVTTVSISESVEYTNCIDTVTHLVTLYVNGVAHYALPVIFTFSSPSQPLIITYTFPDVTVTTLTPSETILYQYTDSSANDPTLSGRGFWSIVIPANAQVASTSTPTPTSTSASSTTASTTSSSQSATSNSATSAPEQNSNGTNSSGLSGGAIGGIVGGVLGGLLVLGILGFILLKKSGPAHPRPASDLYGDPVAPVAPVLRDPAQELKYEMTEEPTRQTLRYPDPDESIPPATDQPGQRAGGRLGRDM